MREVPGFGMTKRDLDWYREGYSDAFSWVLRNLDLEPDDRDLVEKALEPLSRPGALSSEDAKEEVPPPCQEWVRLLRTVRGRFSAQFFHGARGMTGSSEGLGTAVSGEFGWMTWPLCSRAVSTYRNTSGRLAMLAHRVCFPHARSFLGGRDPADSRTHRVNIWAVMEAVASVSLSHEEDCRCLTCRAALDEPGAMATLLADLQAREDATRPTGDKE